MNRYHDHFPAGIDVLIETIFTAEDMTVFTYNGYSQFLDAEVYGDTLVPVTEKDAEIYDDDSTEGRISILVKIIRAIINWFKKLFGFIGE